MRTYPRNTPKRFTPKRKPFPVTVCLAAIAQNGTILSAADRMVTSGDIQYEPASVVSWWNPKVFPISNSIFVMIADDIALQTEILTKHVIPTTNAKIAEDQKKWLSVSFVVDCYVKAYQTVRRNAAEARILFPLGLNYKSFADQSKFNPEFLEKVSTRLTEFTLPVSGATIIAGIDSDEHGHPQPHIWAIYEDHAVCQDRIGFAAIGSGARHAESYFMQVQHGRTAPLPEALISTYIAKKQAEIAPGVGSETDMWFVGPNPGTLEPLNSGVMAKMQEIYKAFSEARGTAVSAANVAADAMIQEAVASVTATKQESLPRMLPRSHAGFSGVR